MKPASYDNTICCLCGEPITCRDSESDYALSMDHVPPRQFYPKSTRKEKNLDLWVVPTHRRCNGDYKNDEEYFYHALYPLAKAGSPLTGQTIFRDLTRRAAQPQTRVLIRGLLNTSRTETSGGILLPPGVVQLSVDEHRIQRVAIKIARGLFFRKHGVFMPRDNCKDIRLCESKEDVPEIYAISWQLGEMAAVSPDIFSCTEASCDGLQYWTLVFWEAFAFCLAFEDPENNQTAKAEI